MKQTIKSVVKRLAQEIPFIETDLTIKRLKAISDSCLNYLSQESIEHTATLLWPTPFNPEKTWVAHDSLLIWALRLRGVKILPTMCNQLQSQQCMIWAGVWQGTDEPGFEKRRKRLCQSCVRNDLQIWQLQQIKPIQLSQFVSPLERQALWKKVDAIMSKDWEAYEYRGYPVGFEARKAVVNNQLQGEIKPAFRAKANELAKFHLYNILALFEAYDAILTKYTPNRVMGNGGFYYHWGVLNHLAQAQGIPYYRYYPVGLQPYSWNYALNTTEIIELSPGWPSWSKQPFTEKMQQKVKAHLLERQFYLDTKDHPNYQQRVDTIAKTYGIDTTKSMVLMLTGVIWDANTNVSSPAFDTMYEWLWYSFDWARMHPDVQVVVRVHPADNSVPTVAPETRSSFAKELKELNISVPENVTIIPATDTTDTYDLMHMAQAGVCYMSTTGLEFATLGKPLIAIGPVHYTQKGFTLEPKTKEAYTQMLNQVSQQPIVDENISKLAQMYWYLYAFHISTDLGLMEKVAQNSMGIKRGIDVFTTHPKVLTYEDLIPGANRQLDYLCDSVIENRPLLSENRWPPEYHSQVIPSEVALSEAV